MNGAAAKDVRRAAAKAITPAIDELHRRIDNAEDWILAFSRMRFWRRMRWLLTGR